MKAPDDLVKRIGQLGLFVALWVSVNSLGAGLFGSGDVRWKEETLLHDGNKIIVERRQSYGGRHEIGQSPPIKEQEITFTVPGTSQRITWKTEFSEDVGRSNFLLLALHILNNTPYIVAEPHLCLSYNKWGRPNPPYVIFRYEDKEWKRILLQDLPTEFKDINLVISTKTEEKTIIAQSPVSADLVKKLNGNLKQSGYRTILRVPVNRGTEGSLVNCEELVSDGKGGWLGIDWFTSQPTFEACVKVCERKSLSPNCPCNRIYGRK